MKDLTEKQWFQAAAKDSENGRGIASYFILDAYFEIQRNMVMNSGVSRLVFDKKMLEETRKKAVIGCNKEGKVEKSTCERAFDNGVWQACQELKKPPKACKDYSYSNSAKDVFTSPYFWGPFGLFMGILMVTVAFLVMYCVCLKKKKNKGMTGGKGNGKGKMFKGSGSQETPMTPGTGSKSPIAGNGNGNNQKSPGGGFGNGKKYQQGVSPNQETYMY